MTMPTQVRCAVANCSRLNSASCSLKMIHSPEIYGLSPWDNCPLRCVMRENAMITVALEILNCFQWTSSSFPVWWLAPEAPGPFIMKMCVTVTSMGHRLKSNPLRMKHIVNPVYIKTHVCDKRVKPKGSLLIRRLLSFLFSSYRSVFKHCFYIHSLYIYLWNGELQPINGKKEK